MTDGLKLAARRRQNGYSLTDVKIRALKPALNKKGESCRKRYADGNGLFLVVGTTGTKWWEYRFTFEGKKTCIGLGPYPVVGLSKAREKHLAARRELEEGRNPAVGGKKAKRQAEKARAAAIAVEAMTFAKVAECWLENREKNSIKRIWETRGRLRNHVFPALGDVPIKDISTARILETLLAVKAKGLEEMSKRCLTSVRQIFNFAVIREWIDRNPAEPLTAIEELRRSSPPEHHRAVKTPAELARLLLDLETIKSTIIGAALWISPYVFVRASELAGMRWDEIDWPESLWRIPKERMKAKRPHFVPLARQVQAFLEDWRNQTGWGTCVFPGHANTGQAPINPDSFRATLNRLGYGRGNLVNHTHHGFRSVASTFLREQGFNSDWIECQLAHGESNKTVAAYNHAEYLPQRRDMMQAWADYIDRLRAEAAGTAPEPGPEAAPEPEPQEIESPRRPVLSLVR